VIAFDEVQKIKTPGTIMTRAAKAMNADFTIAMTGTPVENRLADLWCIMDTVQPGLLGDLKSFSQKYECEPDLDELKALQSRLMDEREAKAPPMLRRMKSDRLKGLPEKREHRIEVPMPSRQAAAYSEAVSTARTADEKGAMLRALQQFRAISLHPVHPEQDDVAEYVAQSARYVALFRILDDVQARGEKALIFLESREAQPVLASIIQRKYGLPRQPLLINGAVSGPKRQDRVNLFQAGGNGFDVMILSPRAGGVGLTLTAANNVVHLSRWWNPAVEDQCTDRVYRIGQVREVNVYYPLAVHPEFGESSFDLRLHALLERKRELSRQLLMPPVDPDKDTEALFSSTVGRSAENIEPNIIPDVPITLEDIDVMEPLQFEQWVLDRLRKQGYEVSSTPRTHDHGADGVAKHPKSGKVIVIQCKHVQRDAILDTTAVNDLLRAKGRYADGSARYVAISNARGYTEIAAIAAEKANIVLINRSDLEKWPVQVL
jgi:SNF2 family DNA or RNA helicase